MQKITLNEQRLHDKQAACFFTLLFDLGGGGHLLPTSEEQRARCWLCAETPQAKTPKPPRCCKCFILVCLVEHPGLRLQSPAARRQALGRASGGSARWRICTEVSPQHHGMRIARALLVSHALSTQISPCGARIQAARPNAAHKCSSCLAKCTPSAFVIDSIVN